MSEYPAWWTLRSGTEIALHAHRIRTTRDLIRAANGMTEDDDGEVVFSGLQALHTFCNKHLRGLTLHLKTAYREKGVRVLGTRPNTVVYHHPCFEPSPPTVTAPITAPLTAPITAPMIATKSMTKPTTKATKATKANEANESNVKPTCFLPPDDEMPLEYVCPISLEVFKDPVVLEDGYTYERHALEDWLRTHTTSPMTGAVLRTVNVFPNHVLRQLILQKIAESTKGGLE